MGKGDYLTPKAIANRMKAKGLQKLRWYCEGCKKQCRDENGFKCHRESQGHIDMLRCVGTELELDSVIEDYSQQFESSFLQLLKPRGRVSANAIYNEYISDRHHVHMNSTIWPRLTDFVVYLGKMGKCKVEDTPKGWFLSYIDRDRVSQTLKKAKFAIDNEERALQKQIELAAAAAAHIPPNSYLNLPQPKEFPSGKVAFSVGGKKRKYVYDMKEEEEKKELINRSHNWLCQGIVVKVISKALPHNLYNHKGVVLKVIDNTYGEIQLLERNHVLKLHQEDLETVIPQIGCLVRIVNGAYRSSIAKLLSIDEKKFSAKVQIEKGLYHGRVIQAIEYEDICKLTH